MQILPYVNGDVSEALQWMSEIDREHGITDGDYGMGDFIDDLERNGYISTNEDETRVILTPKTEQGLRSRALEEIFGKMRKKGRGDHATPYTGAGGEPIPGLRDYRYGDRIEQIAFGESMRTALSRHGADGLRMTTDDLRVREREHTARMATVLMIDISHSMILYGEDRITPAKKVAMGLAELIRRKYPKDALDILVFGNDAWTVEVKDLPYLGVGPYHTNTVAGLELAMDLLRRRKDANKQIFMITDGKPTCIKENGQYYQNSFGLDPKILNKTFQLARQCRRLRIPITTFMIASDPYLRDFVREFTEVNNGRAFYTGLDGLSDMVFEDFEAHRRKRF